MNSYYFMLLFSFDLVALNLGDTMMPSEEFELENQPGYLLAVPIAIQGSLNCWGQKGGDITLILQLTTFVNMVWFDVLAAYHPTAKGIAIDVPKRPEEERTLKNKNIAFLHGAYQVFKRICPSQDPLWRTLLEKVQLDPEDSQENVETPVGIGNYVGISFIKSREDDGMNILGNEGGIEFNREQYRDYTGYQPVNSPYALVNPSRWQPLIQKNTFGKYRIQTFVTPQMGRTRPVTNASLADYQFPDHGRSLKGINTYETYKHDIDEIIAISANLTEEQKALAEFFDNKFNSLAGSVLFYVQTRNLSLEEFVHIDLITNMAAYDTMILVWREKTRHDAVRPVSAAQYIYGKGGEIRGYGGPSIGHSVDRIPAGQWQSYMPASDHPEYPSASAAGCAAHAEAMRHIFGSDEYGWEISSPKGSSNVEPGVSPSEDFHHTFATWTQFETECGLSRLFGGVHFRDSIEVVKEVAHAVGKNAYDFVQAHINP